MSTPPLTPLAAAALRVVPAPERVLEIECGDGDGALFLAREFPAARVRGVDRSAERVRAATARVGLDPEGRVAFKVGRPGALPYPDDFFDLVAQVDGRPAAAEIARVLRPGGQLLLVRSSDPEPTAGLSGWLLRRRLRRRGIELLETAAAGDGSFSVARLRGDGPRPRAD
ncbi:MAG TPA: class I SAM-dependent methyltransferase [Solirubrobacterales bacterium]|nr:class I SAM-dependent methyltransferase [Solirubrobacterales bacterium]